MEKPIIQIGKHKGDFDFSVGAIIGDLTYEEMNEFRAMCMVAIGTSESMWRRMKEQENPPQEHKNNLNNLSLGE